MVKTRQIRFATSRHAAGKRPRVCGQNLPKTDQDQGMLSPI
ncbi:hypothetical protein SynA1825c_00710 [Synechococcus sp. A18-25c]|nr:hypothetical protein SynA1825c_00710 [Synechococcus sp. A18-25c]